MSWIVAVDWDRYEVRCIVAGARGAGMTVQEVRAVPLPAGAAGAAPSPAEVGAALRQAFGAMGLTRPTILVGLDRASVELLHLQLPPATDAELAQLVAHEALRQSCVAGEHPVVDFVAHGDDPAQARKVTAAVLLPERMQQVQQVCAAAGLKPDRLLLRSFAAASLFAHAAAPSPENCLLVNLVAEEVDLTVLQAGRPVFWRTARLPQDAEAEQLSERLFAEIHRTLAVAAQELAEGGIERVYLFAQEDEHAALRARIGEELGLEAACFDPFQALRVPGDLVPPGRGRFAALLGMLLDEVRGGQHALDFLHPRRPPPTVRRGRLVLLGVAAALVAVTVGGALVWRELRAIDQENVQLAQDLKELNALAGQYAKQRRLSQSIRDWQGGDVNWLEELRELSERFPRRQDALVLRMSMTGLPSGGGQITFQGLVRDPSLVVRIEHSLRDAHHGVRTRRIHEGARAESDYSHLFDAAVFVAKREKDQYAAARKERP